MEINMNIEDILNSLTSDNMSNSDKDKLIKEFAKSNKSTKSKESTLSDIAKEMFNGLADTDSLSQSLQKPMMDAFNDLLIQSTFNLLLGMLDEDKQLYIKKSIYDSWDTYIKSDLDNSESSNIMNDLFNTSESQLHAYNQVRSNIKSFLELPEDFE